MKTSIKKKITYLGVGIIVFTVTAIILITYLVFRSYTIEENVDKARKTARQLAAMRGYMATIAPYVRFTKKGINHWAATPAYSGAQVAKKVGQDAGFYIKQTALNYRNPLNKPNEFELKILREMSKNQIKEHHEIGLHNGEKSILYAYRLTVKKPCLKCHGIPKKEIPEEIYNRLIADYGNRAFNLREGDLRGIISVAIPLSLATKSLNTLVGSTIIAGIIILVLVSFISFAFIGKITNPLTYITNRLKEFSKGEGDLTVKLDTKAKDEIGEVTENFNTFVEKIRFIIRDVKDISNELASAMEEQSSTTFSMSENNVILSEKQESILTSSSENAKSMDVVALNVNQQVDSFSALNTRVTELSNVINKVSSESLNAINLTKEISGKISSGEEALKLTSNTMMKIGDSSKEMTNIMSFINDIADQINLLSLNAAIESARAGDAGRGFAVVADEISKLADQTASSIKNIDQLIRTNDAEINSGIDSVQNTVIIINEIIDDISKISTVIKNIFDYMQQQIGFNEEVNKEAEKVKTLTQEINKSVTEYNESSHRINVSIEKIGNIAQSTAASSEELSATSEEITGMSDSLKNLVGKFKV